MSEAITITVTSGGNPVAAGTRVAIHDRNTGALQDYRLTTGADGGHVVTMLVAADTWELRTSKSGVYQSDIQDITVAEGGSAVAVALTALPAITASPAGFTTGHWTAYDEDGEPREGLTHWLQVQRGPGLAGVSLPGARRAAVSDVNGIVQFPGIPHGSQVVVWRGSSDKRGPYLAPATGATWAMDEVLGSP